MVWQLIDCKEARYVLECAFGITIILALLPIKGTDLDNIITLFNEEKRIQVLMQLYLINNISPCNMPKKWFTIISQKECNKENIYLQKMWYYRLLEEGTNLEMIHYVFGKLYPVLMQTKYLKDKCEILFYYALIERNEKKLW